MLSKILALLTAACSGVNLRKLFSVLARPREASSVSHNNVVILITERGGLSIAWQTTNIIESDEKVIASD